jgi:hypothetical protein
VRERAAQLGSLLVACALALVSLGAAARAAPPPGDPNARGLRSLSVKICKRHLRDCGPRARIVRGNLVSYVPRVGEVTARRPRIKCPGTCDVTSRSTATVVLTAIPLEDPSYGQYRFAGWSGPCLGQRNPCSFPLPRGKPTVVKAIFAFTAGQGP